MSHELWRLDGSTPVFVASHAQPEGLDAALAALPKGTIIAKSLDGIVSATNGGVKEFDLFRAAIARAWLRRGGRSTDRTAPVAAPVAKPPARKASPRPFVGGVLTETPVAGPGPAEIQLARERAEEAEARAARMTAELTRLRGEVEGLTTDLSVARHDLARAIDRSGEMAADLGAQLDDARALLGLAMTTGLAAADEARAEADRVARHAGELSRRLAAATDAAAPAGVVDDLALARITRASERGTLRALGLHALVTRHGGVERVEQLIAGVDRLMKAVG